MIETRYCPKCEKKTGTIFNDFMVMFCLECKTMRGDKSHYTREKQPFKCLHCGRLLEENFVGQKICSDCSNGLQSV
jgi:hypothetical protein